MGYRIKTVSEILEVPRNTLLAWERRYGLVKPERLPNGYREYSEQDIETLRSLEAALESYAGCAVIISHDRWFLDRIATHTLAFEGDSQVRWFEGNFSDYEAYRRKELGAAADQPTRIKYKPLTRN